MNFLEEITARIAAEERPNFLSFSPDRFPLKERPEPADVLQMLDEKFALIAEVKKRSPSKGVLREDFDPVVLALSYEEAGALAISVITEKNYFSGEKAHLSRVKSSVGLPVLRKDFLIHPYQVYESYNLGADFVLLIAACLSRENLKTMMEAARSLGLETLVEVHDEEDLEKALDADPRMIGINNRNLETLEVNFRTSLRLKKLIPGRIHVISESGINSPRQIRRLREEGFSGVLIGEYLLKQNDVASALKELMDG
ncbi:MAG: indole-3-glycerol phosphate synthase TrpC [Candidatus Aminicenantales bacterium]